MTTNKTQQSTTTRQRGQIIRSTAVGLLKLGFTPQQVAYCIHRKKLRDARRNAKREAVQGRNCQRCLAHTPKLALKCSPTRHLHCRGCGECANGFDSMLQLSAASLR
jgi:hypothetical protein